MKERFTIQNGTLLNYSGPGGEVTIPYGVTEIDYNLHNSLGEATRIVLPASISTLRNFTFSNLDKLESVCLPDTDSLTELPMYMFNGCTSLREITIPRRVKVIKEHTFGRCSSLKEIVIPKLVHTIGNNAFSDCRALKKVTILGEVENIQRGAFSYCTSLESIHLPKGLAEIGEMAFCGCSSLTEIIIPEGVQKIGAYAFKNCDNLTRVILPASLTKIDGSAFANCPCIRTFEVSEHSLHFCVKDSGLYSKNGRTLVKAFSRHDTMSPETYTVSDDVVRIGAYAFANNTSLKQINLPAGLKYIEKYAFHDCTSLTAIELPQSLVSIKEGVFAGCTSLAGITLPEQITHLATYLFADCTSLYSVTLPPVLSIIGNSAFQNCYALCEITLPQGLTGIGQGAFTGCKSLHELSIPESVTGIGHLAFRGCTGLSRITIPSAVKELHSWFDYSASLEIVLLCKQEEPIDKYTFETTGPFIAPHIPLSAISTSLRRQAVLGFIRWEASGKTYDAPIHDAYVKYIRLQKRRLYPLALEQESLLLYLLQENLISKADLLELLEQAAKSENASINAILLEHRQKMITPADEEKVWKKQMNTLLTGAETAADAKKRWRYEKTDAGTVRIIGYKGTDTQIVIPCQIGRLQVTEIGDFAFSPRQSPLTSSVRETRRHIQSIVIPETVQQIALNAFQCCTGLNQISIAENHPVYGIQDGLLYEKATRKLLAWLDSGQECCHIPDGIEEIPDRFFAGRTVKKVRLPESLFRIGAEAFKDCLALQEITLPGSLMEIKESAFYGCNRLSKLYIPSGVIENDAFASCAELKQVRIGSNVSSLGEWCFARCEKISELILEEGIAQIGSHAFEGCTSLTQLRVPGSIHTIMQETFYYCTGLTHLEIASGIQKIDQYAFCGCKGLEELTVPGSVERIGGGAFSDCTSLTRAVLENGVKDIRSNAFHNCTSLTEAAIPASVKSIVPTAFSQCPLEHITGTAKTAAWEFAQTNDISFIE